MQVSVAWESTGFGGESTFWALSTLLHRGIHEQEASAFFYCGRACEHKRYSPYVVSVPVCRVASLTERTCARMNWCVCSLSPGLMFWVYCCIVVCAWCLHSACARTRMALDMGVPGASLQLVHVIHYGPYFARPDNCLCARNK
jgi:hypothetical protein